MEDEKDSPHKHPSCVAWHDAHICSRIQFCTTATIRKSSVIPGFNGCYASDNAESTTDKRFITESGCAEWDKSVVTEAGCSRPDIPVASKSSDSGEFEVVIPEPGY